MVDLQDILKELNMIKGTEKVRGMIIEYVENIEDEFLKYQEFKEHEIKVLSNYLDMKD